MSKENDILKCISTEDIAKLLEVLRKDEPHSNTAYNWIRKHMDWASKIQGLRVQIFCPNGDWADGTFVGLSQGLIANGKVLACVYTLQDNCEKLKEVLMKSSCIPWQDIAWFTSIADKHVSIIQSVFPLKVMNGFTTQECVHFSMPIDQATTLIFPENHAPGLRISSLDLTHLDVVCNNWSHYSERNRPVVQAMVEHNLSVGVFVTGEDGKEELASMVLESDFGGIGLLQTVPKYRKRGFATLALTFLTQKMGKAGIRPHLHVLANNQDSVAMMQRSGFKSEGKSFLVSLSDASQDILQSVASENVAKLLQVLKEDLPRSSVAYNWIKMQTTWDSILPDVNVQILCPKGNWKNGTVVAFSRGLILAQGAVDGIIYTLQESCEELKEALTLSKIIPWQNMACFSGVIEKHLPVLKFAVDYKGFNFPELPPYTLFQMSAEEAAKVSLPAVSPGIRIGPIDVKHLDIVCHNWPYYSEKYQNLIKTMLENNLSVGVFVEREDGEEDLAAMVLNTFYGGVGFMQTVPRYRRKGYATLALTSLTQTLGKAGVSPHLHVLVDNYKALTLVQKVGFKKVCQTYFVCLFADC